MEKVQKILSSLFCITLAMIFLTLDSKAIQEIEIDPDFKGDESAFLNSLPVSSSKNEFSKYESGIFRRVYPFNFPPFFKSDISFKKNKDAFSPKEEISLSGFAKYWNSEAEKDIKKTREDCLETWKNESDVEKEKICPEFKAYRIPRIEDLRLFVQVWKKDETENRNLNGDFLVDEFYVENVFSLEEGKEAPLNFKWQVPGYAQSGNYYFSFFINSNRNFPIFSFVQNIFSPLEQEPFEVKGLENAGIWIDKDNITLNDSHYYPIRRTPTVEPSQGKFTIKSEIVNSSDQNEKISLKYKLFNWTQEDNRNLLSEREETIELAKGERKEIKFVYDDYPGESVNTLSIEAKYSSGKSIINVPFVVANKDKARLMFLGQLEDSERVYPYACAQYNAWKGSFKGEIQINASDKDNLPIANWSQKGIISFQDAFCFILDGGGFEKINKNQCFNLDSKILDENGKEVFKEAISLNCKLENSSNPTVVKEGNNLKLYLIAILTLIILSVFSLFIINKKLKN